jgi:hypothetical protein
VCGIAVSNARDCVIEGNSIEQPCFKEPIRVGQALGLDKPLYAVYLAAVEQVTVKANRVLNPSPHCLGPVGLGKWVKQDTVRTD